MSAPEWKARVDPTLRPLLRKLPWFTFGPVTRRLFHAAGLLVPTPRPRAGIAVRRERVGPHDLILFRPEDAEPRGALLWIHGGGLIMGSPKLGAHHCMRIAQALGIVVVATGYRLAPGHPFPAALDDCAASWAWLLEHAEALGIPPGRLVVGGESAGGGLAAALAQRLRDEGGPQPAGQLLVYPMLDDRTAARDELSEQAHLVWSNGSNHYGWSSYLAQPPGAAELPRYASAARHEDLGGLPAAWLAVGTLDLFLDEDRAYAERLRAAGVPVELEIIEGAFHGYFAVGRDEPPVERTWASLETFLRTCLELEPASP